MLPTRTTVLLVALTLAQSTLFQPAPGPKAVGNEGADQVFLDRVVSTRPRPEGRGKRATMLHQSNRNNVSTRPRPEGRGKRSGVWAKTVS
jgi:hypothetical protein